MGASRERGKEGERERGRIPNRLYTVKTEPDTGLELTNCEIMTWAKIKSQMLNRLRHPGGEHFKVVLCSFGVLKYFSVDFF